MNYIMNNNSTSVGTTHNFFTYTTANTLIQSLQITSTNINILDAVSINFRRIFSTSNTSATHAIFTNMISGGILTLESLTSNIINNFNDNIKLRKYI